MIYYVGFLMDMNEIILYCFLIYIKYKTITEENGIRTNI